MSKVLLFGETGMLGIAIKKVGELKSYTIIPTSLSSKYISIDIQKSEEIRNLIYNTKPELVINAAALVNIEDCEVNPQKAYLINARPVSIMAESCKKINSHFIQISTDHFFSGYGRKKHKEDSKITLLNEYARSKYAGEAFASTFEKSLIIRTNIVGFRSSTKMTFVEWVIDSLINKKEITLFDDYFTSSIHVRQLANVIFDLFEKKQNGILNVGSHDVYSKKDFVVKLAQELNLSILKTNSGKVSESTLITRAVSNGLDVSRVEEILGYNMPSLKDVILSICEEYRNHRYAI